jgi:hypothetical protein
VHDDPQIARAERAAGEPGGERERQAEAGAGDHERDPGGPRGDRRAAEHAVRDHVRLRHRERGSDDQKNKAGVRHGPHSRSYSSARVASSG